MFFVRELMAAPMCLVFDRMYDIMEWRFCSDAAEYWTDKSNRIAFMLPCRYGVAAVYIILFRQKIKRHL